MGASARQSRDGWYVVLVALVLLVLAVGTWRRPAPPEGSRGMGRARNLDIELVRGRIQEGSLSGHEAEFYRRLGEGTAP